MFLLLSLFKNEKCIVTCNQTLYMPLICDTCCQYFDVKTSTKTCLQCVTTIPLVSLLIPIFMQNFATCTILVNFSVQHSESRFKHNKYEMYRNHTQNLTTCINLCIITHYPCNLVNVSFPLLQDFYRKYFQTNRDVV